MRPNYEKPNWIVASISLGAFGAIIVILFAVMSGPFSDITDMITEQSENMDVDSDVDPFISMITNCNLYTYQRQRDATLNSMQ